MKNLTLFIITIFCTSSIKGQNLIPNPSFENINFCEMQIPCSPSAWYSLSDIPYGFQNSLIKSIDGKRSIAIMIAFEKEIRFYWQTMLLSNLQEGQKYDISFWLYSPNIKFEPEYIGVHLSDTLFRSKNDTLMQIEECKCVKDVKPRTSKNGWLELKFSFISTGKEKYLLMGNLSSLSNKEILKKSGSNLKYIEYYIDNISLKPNNKSTIKCSDYNLRLDSLFAENIRHANIKNKTPIDPQKVTEYPKAAPLADTIVLGKINFEFDSETLINTSNLKRYFDSTGLNEITKIQIIGYTDSIGSESYNLKLSRRRASSVNNYLVNILQLPQHLITAIGKGIIKDNNNLAYNRRVELIITKKR